MCSLYKLLEAILCSCCVVLMHLELEIYTRTDSAAVRLSSAVRPHMAMTVNFFAETSSANSLSVETWSYWMTRSD